MTRYFLKLILTEIWAISFILVFATFNFFLHFGQIRCSKMKNELNSINKNSSRVLRSDCSSSPPSRLKCSHFCVCFYRKEETSYQEASERFHVIHEGNEGESCCGVHSEGKRCDQSNPRTAGEFSFAGIFFRIFFRSDPKNPPSDPQRPRVLCRGNSIHFPLPSLLFRP